MALGDRVQVITETDDDAMATLLGKADQIISLLTEIRDDQRAVQGDTLSGKVTKTKDLLDALL